MVKKKNRKKVSKERRNSSKERLSSRERLVRFRQNHLLPVFLLVLSLAFVVCIVAVTWESPGITSAFVVDQGDLELEEVKDPLIDVEGFVSKAKQYWKWSIPMELIVIFSLLLLLYQRKMAGLPVASMPPKKRYKRHRKR